MVRLSDHRFLANYFRLYLHAAALDLLVRLRREIADQPPGYRGHRPRLSRSASCPIPRLPSERAERWDMLRRTVANDECREQIGMGK